MPHNNNNYEGEAAVIALLRRQLLLSSLPGIIADFWEGCLADAALMLTGGHGRARPIQIKTTRVVVGGKNRQNRQNRQFKFQGTDRYPGCIVLCCAFVKNETLHAG